MNRGKAATQRSVAMVALLLLCVSPAAAQARLTLNAQAGVGDKIRPGAQTPIQVTLTNGPTAYQGRLTAVFLQQRTELSTVTREVDLAAGASKRITLYLPATGKASGMRVEYETFRGPLGWRAVTGIEQDLTQTDSEIPVFGGLTVVPRGLPPERAGNNRQIYYRYYLQPAQLPDRQEGLAMFDALFLTPPAGQSYTTPQMRAIGEWVLRGGILVVDASAPGEAYRAGRLGDILPFIPQASDQGTLPLFDREVLYTTGNIGDGEVLLESGGVPLVVRRSHGLGSVVTFAVAPDDPALQNWDKREDLWHTILGDLLKPSNKSFTTSGAGGYFGPKVGEIADRLANNVTEAPSTGMRLGLVLLMTGLYALVAGPGDYLLVRRLKKPRMTWITFPLIVAFFTLAAWLGARFWIGGDWEQRTAERLAVFPELNTALRFDLAGVFVPQGDEYTIRSDRPAMLRHIGDLYGLEDRTAIDGDEGTVSQTIPIWTHRAYVTSETLTGYDNLDATWTWTPDTVDILVTNNSDRTLSPKYVMAGQRVWSLRNRHPAIGPNETALISVLKDDIVRPNPDTEPGEEPGPTPPPLLDPSGPSVPDAWIPYDRPAYILHGLAAGHPGRSPFARELNLRAPLSRGAQVITFEAEGGESLLTVDGDDVPTANARSIIQIISYERRLAASTDEAEQISQE